MIKNDKTTFVQLSFIKIVKTKVEDVSAGNEVSLDVRGKVIV